MILSGELDVELLADFIRDKIESEPYQGLHPELSSMGLALAIRDEFFRLRPPQVRRATGYRAPIVDGEPCFWCDPVNGPCRIHGVSDSGHSQVPNESPESA